MHAGRGRVVDLHAIHADVLHAAFRIAGDDQRQGDEGAAVERPRGQYRQAAQVGRVLDDLLDGRVLDDARQGEAERTEGRRLREPLLETARPAQVDDPANAGRDLLDALRAEGHGHAPFGAELVGQYRIVRAGDVGEEQRGAACLHDPVGDFRDFEAGVDARAHLGEFAGAPQRRHELR